MPLSTPDLLTRMRTLPPPAQLLAAQCLSQLGWRESLAPLPQDPDAVRLRQACERDVKRFASEFFPHFCTKAFSSMHEDFFADYVRRHDQRGWRDATAAPRGNAKTTIKGIIKPVHDCVYRLERFIVVISSRHDLAIDKVDEIRTELDQNQSLIRAFGPQKGPRWNKGDFITSRGVRVLAASRGSQIRGLNWRGIRPTKILLDDAERSDEVLSEMQREKFWTWLNGDILKLGTTGYTNHEIIGTVLHPQSALCRLLSNPGWHSRRYQAVMKFADQAPELWQQWRDLYCNLDDGDHQQTARDFFNENSEQMLAGHEVLWPEGETYYDLMEMIIIEGIAAFELEKQNNPILPDAYPFDMDTAAYFNLEPGCIVRSGKPPVAMGELEIYAFWDPALGSAIGEPDWSCCTIIGKDPRGYFYVLDCYLTQHTPIHQQTEAIADLLWRWEVPQTGIESNHFQSLLIPDLKEALAQRALDEGRPWTGRILEIKNMRDKPSRILTLEPLVANGWLVFSDRLPGEAFRQMREFIPVKDAGKDDFPDSLEGAVRVAKGLYDRRSGSG